MSQRQLTAGYVFVTLSLSFNISLIIFSEVQHCVLAFPDES